jgi:hypothetical protein
MSTLEYSFIQFCGDPSQGRCINVGLLAVELETGRGKVLIDADGPRRAAASGIGTISRKLFAAIELDLREMIEDGDTVAASGAYPKTAPSKLAALVPLASNQFQFSEPKRKRGEPFGKAIDDLFSQMVATLVPATS